MAVRWSHLIGDGIRTLQHGGMATNGVNTAGDAGDTSPQYFGWGGHQWEYPLQYYTFICAGLAVKVLT